MRGPFAWLAVAAWLTASGVSWAAEHDATPEALDAAGERAAAAYDAKDWEHAYAASSEAADAVQRMITRISRPGETDENFGAPVAVSGADSEQAGADALGLYSRFFRRKILSAWQLSEAAPRRKDELSDQAFRAAQMLDYSSAQRALAQLSARLARGDNDLAKLIRDRQDLSRRDAALWRQHAPADNLQDEAHDQIARKISQIDKTLLKRFPDYYESVTPRPYSIADVQRRLGKNEALLLFFESYEMAGIPEALLRCQLGTDCEGPGKSFAFDISLSSPQPTEKDFAWLVTKEKSKWVRLPHDRRGIGARALRLRCGLDSSLWADPTKWPESPAKEQQATSRKRCLGMTEGVPAEGSMLPFDLEMSNELFEVLFGQLKEEIQGRQLLVVPSESLRTLPLNVLLKQAPMSGRPLVEQYRKALWLGRENAISILPAVASLRMRDSVRAEGGGPKDRRPYLGFGNPLLDGPTADYAALKKAAADRRSCAEPSHRNVGVTRGDLGSPPLPRGVSSVNIGKLKRAAPLPETADELCDVASVVGAIETDVFLGARATEREVKRLSEKGLLAKYSIVHFATHGTLAGQVSGSTEPGLILTPPEKGDGTDDGYLTASEISDLKIDADWVILSACNTSGGDNRYSEPMSGLARAFLYAGTRALLVSHWYVNSNATVALVKGIFTAQRDEPAIGRAEAFRRSMAALIDNGSDSQTHPSVWAPFVLLGEGGAGP